MKQKYSHDERVERLVRADELEVSGEHPDELGEYFAPNFRFHGPGGFQADFDGLSEWFASVRDAFDDRVIRHGIMVVEGDNLACQTFIDGTFAHEFTQAPGGPVPPNRRRVLFDLINIVQMDDEGRLTHEYVRTDNRSFLEQLTQPAA
ncbi:MAG TPA: ester cyclase [Pseudolysinimonas sp.]|nr:ester cyclase [Pseudolysinimonas sp.]